MGDKTTARRLAEECGVPTVPGSKDPINDASDALTFAKESGYPVILKAAMGGGGRGMRVVQSGLDCTLPTLLLLLSSSNAVSVCFVVGHEAY